MKKANKKGPVTKKKAPAKKKVTKKVSKKVKSTPVSKKVAKKKVVKEKIVVEAKTVPEKRVAPAKKKKVVAKRPKSKTTVRNYLSNKELMAAVMESKEMEKMSNDLAFKLQLLTSKYARSAQFARYTFNDDMQAYAMMMLVRTWNSFKPEKSNNPFSFFTQCIKNSFIQFLNQEKRQRNIRDELLVDKGLSPSFTYQLEHESKMAELAAENDEQSDVDTHRHPDSDSDVGSVVEESAT